MTAIKKLMRPWVASMFEQQHMQLVIPKRGRKSLIILKEHLRFSLCSAVIETHF